MPDPHGSESPRRQILTSLGAVRGHLSGHDFLYLKRCRPSQGDALYRLPLDMTMLEFGAWLLPDNRSYVFCLLSISCMIVVVV